MACITQHDFPFTEAKIALSHGVCVTKIFEKAKNIELLHN
jgi:hypothetical protein